MEGKNEEEKIENASANADQGGVDVGNTSAFVPRDHKQPGAAVEDRPFIAPKDAVVAFNSNIETKNVCKEENLLLLFCYACTSCLRNEQTNMEPEEVSLERPTTFNVANKYRKLSKPEYGLCLVFIVFFFWALFNLILTTILFFYDFEDKLKTMFGFCLIDFDYLLICVLSGYLLAQYRVKDKERFWAVLSFYFVFELVTVGMSFLYGVDLLYVFRILSDKNPN